LQNHNPLLPWSQIKGGIILHIRITPNAAHTRIDDVELRDNNQQVLRVRVTAVPDKGKANKALIALLAKTLKLPKSTISIKTGLTSRHKTIQIVGDSEELLERSKNLASLKQTTISEPLQ
jgi:uncharacterized protein (TIGR00251 family)